MFYLFVSSFNIKGHVCTQELAVNQTSWGGLSVKHKGYQKARFRTWCVVRKTYQRLAVVWNRSIYIYTYNFECISESTPIYNEFG